MEELYKQEILELTELLKEDEGWEDLRNVLVLKGFDLTQILLVSFMENEEENEYGVIVTSGYKKGLLLPDLEGVDTIEEQIAIAKNKAGILKDEEISLERFTVTRHK